jgi:putative salt-induced outer membrane protein YdiY
LIETLPALVHAADTMYPADGQWKGRGTLGFSSTSGNTDSENLNAALQAGYEKLRWKHNLSFEAIRAEVGGDNTFLQSETALLLKINSRLSSKISYLVRHNTDVSDDVEKTDETVSFSLVYDF